MSKKSVGLARPIQSRDVRDNSEVVYSSLSEAAKIFDMTQVQLSEHLRSTNASKRTWKWNVFRYASDAHLPWPQVDPQLAIEYSFSLRGIRLYVVEHIDLMGVRHKKVLPWIEDVNKHIHLKVNKLDKLNKPRTVRVGSVDFHCRLATPEELLENSALLSEASRIRSNRLCASYIKQNHPSPALAALAGTDIEEGTQAASADAVSISKAFSILTHFGR